MAHKKKNTRTGLGRGMVKLLDNHKHFGSQISLKFRICWNFISGSFTDMTCITHFHFYIPKPCRGTTQNHHQFRTALHDPHPTHLPVLLRMQNVQLGSFQVGNLQMVPKAEKTKRCQKSAETVLKVNSCLCFSNFVSMNNLLKTKKEKNMVRIIYSFIKTICTNFCI